MKNYKNLMYSAVTLQIFSFVIYQGFNMGGGLASQYSGSVQCISSLGFLLSWVLIAYISYRTPTSLRTYFRYYWRTMLIMTLIMYIDYANIPTPPLWALFMLPINFAIFVVYPIGGIGYIIPFSHSALVIATIMCVVSSILDKNARGSSIT